MITGATRMSIFCAMSLARSTPLRKSVPMGVCRAVLFERRDRNDHHIRAVEEVLDFRPRHMGKVVFDLFFVPERISLRVAECGTSEY